MKEFDQPNHREFYAEMSSRMKERLGDNLTPPEAVTEIIDNSAGYRNERASIDEPIPTILLRVDKATGEIWFDQIGGQGVDISDQDVIESIFRLGESSGHSIGKFGIGLPSAIWKLRPSNASMIIKAEDSSTEYVVDLREFANTGISLQESRIRTHESPYQGDFPQLARFSLYLQGIHQKLMAELSLESLVSILSERYAPILASSQTDQIQTPRFNPNSGQWELSYNQILIRLTHVDPRGNSVEKVIVPPRIDLEVEHEDPRRFTPADVSAYQGVSESGEEYLMPFWAGVMEKPDVSKARETSPGTRFYYDGILLGTSSSLGVGPRTEDGEVLRQVYAEFNVDHYPGIKELMRINKASSIDWRSTKGRQLLADSLDALHRYGIIDYVRKRRQERKAESLQPQFLRDAAQQAHDAIHDAIKNLVKLNLLNEDFLELCIQELGQRDPSHNPINEEEKPPTTTSRVGTRWSDQHPRSLNPDDSSERRPRKRFGVFHDVQYARLGNDGQIVSQILDAEKYRILLLNLDNDIVKVARFQDTVALKHDSKAKPFSTSLVIAQQTSQHLLEVYLEGLSQEIAEDPSIVFDLHNRLTAAVASVLMRDRYVLRMDLEMVNPDLANFVKQ